MRSTGRSLPRSLVDLLDRLYDVWAAARDRMTSNPRFQRWASRFPLTRPIARRRVAGLFDLVSGFVYTQVLLACVRARVIERVRDVGPQTAAQLAPALDLTTDAATRLLDAAASLGLLERRSRGRYGIGPHGASYLGNPFLADMIEHHTLFYRDLEDPLALLRGERADTELGAFWCYARGEAGRGLDAPVAGYSELMARSLPMLAEDVLDAYPDAGRGRVLDVAGGLGVFAEALARRAPSAAISLFDLPPVAERARARLDSVGLGERIAVVGGDVFRDSLPGPVDVVSLVRVLHDHDDEAALQILRAARGALEPGGALLVAEPMRLVRGAERLGDAYFGFYLLAMGQGRARSPERVGELLRIAGFSRVRARETRRPMLAQLVVGHAPARV